MPVFYEIFYEMVDLPSAELEVIQARCDIKDRINPKSGTLVIVRNK